MPMVNHYPQTSLNDDFINATPPTHQSLQRPFVEGNSANQISYPALDQPPYPVWEQREGRDFGHSSNYEFPAYHLHATATLRLAASGPLPSSKADVTAASAPPLITTPAHPITGRYTCSYPTRAQDFKRSSDRLQHISSVHQRGQTNQGKNLCPVVGYRQSYGRGLCRPDKFNNHLKKVHGLVTVTPNSGAASAGSSVHGTGNSSNVAGRAVALAGNGN
ncbi:uncharacterized protein EAF01_000156 [Botrytis porri]|uniref:Uncharacterized protein n=1 Tax=Botrytis porri TaxID=87229 RepID=A0A4Z1KC78_9HELO|nr:uncharacterized protein EAF01_000156 [Botrytis porri]KAF7913750.1 hypothetical protein EAF01_000156 [Botrytis porri]TGO82986.1 hypothetical protein BPOR_0722g00020 [Botrytis porri]